MKLIAINSIFRGSVFLSFSITLFVSCNSKEIENTKSENLLSLARTYGYIKYFHPSDEAANLDWDAFAVLASKKISESKNLRKSWEDLFLPIAPSISFNDNNTLKSKFSPNDSLKETFWQHIGNGKGSVGVIYKSLRVNKNARVLAQSTNNGGGIIKRLDADNFIGKELSFDANLRPNYKFVGKFHIAVSIKRKDKIKRLRVESLTQDQFKGKWNIHKVKVIVPEDAESIHISIGGFLMLGSIEVKGIKLSVFSNGIFEEFDFETESVNTIDEFKAVWRTSGPHFDFKYDTNLLTMMRSNGRLRNMTSLFKSENPFPKFLKQKIDENLTISIPTVLKTNEKNTFPRPPHDVYQRLLKNLDSINLNISIDNIYVRLANIIKTWTTFRHFYPYFDLVDVDWDKQFVKAIAKNETDNGIEDHLNTLKLLISPLKDSHMQVVAHNKEEYFPPIRLELIEDNLVITDVYDNNLEVSIGTVIKKINDVDWKVLFQDIDSRIPAATKTFKKHKIAFEVLVGDKETTLKITTQENGEIKLKRSINYDDFIRLNKKYRNVLYKELEPSIFYVNIQEIKWADLKEKLPELVSARGVIFDLRGYPTFGMGELIGHITKDSLEKHRKLIPRLTHPEQLGNSFEEEGLNFNLIPNIVPKQPFIGARKVFLTDGTAISFAESFLNPVEHYNLADIVGEQTAGSTGLTNNIHLFGDVFIPWTGMKILKQDGSQFHGIGIIPNYQINRTLDGVRCGNDEYLEYALELIKGRK